MTAVTDPSAGDQVHQGRTKLTITVFSRLYLRWDPASEHPISDAVAVGPPHHS